MEISWDETCPNSTPENQTRWIFAVHQAPRLLNPAMIVRQSTAVAQVFPPSAIALIV